MDKSLFTNKPISGFNYRPETEDNSILAPYSIGETLHKTVHVLNCIYKGDNGFAIYDVEEDARRFVILGNFPYDLALNAYYKVTGEVAVNKRNNTKQLQVNSCQTAFPDDREGILTVLRTLHGLDTQAFKLYSIIGPNILDILQNNPEQIAKTVKGVGIKRAKAWQQELLARGENDRELQKLYSLGLTPKQAIKLVSESGIEICDQVSVNPYLLIGKFQGYTFKKCDKIALDKGLSIYNIDRIREGFLYIIKSIENKGHCSYPKDAFIETAHNLLDVSVGFQTASKIINNSVTQVKYGDKVYSTDVADLSAKLAEWRQGYNKNHKPFVYVLEKIDDKLFEQALFDLRTSESIVIENLNGREYVTSGLFYRAEVNIKSAVNAFVSNEILPFKNVDKVIKKVLSDLNIELEKKQLEAVYRISQAQGGIFILNGSAGSGKTFTLNIIMRVLKELYRTEKRGEFTPCILAPTGKAAKVAAQSTKLIAQTIHRKLGIVSNDDTAEIQSDCFNNCIVVDEMSMVDELLCSQLFQGIPKTAKIILLGDTKQLPSIRAGRVLKDLIESGIVPVISLNVVKRQEAKSGILINATKITNGEHISPVIVNEDSIKNNAYIEMCNNPFEAQTEILKTAIGYGLNAFQRDEIQVLAPLKMGPAGILSLNYMLQQALNPPADDKPETAFGKLQLQTEKRGEETVITYYRVGDCVIHTKNNYEQSWYKKHPVNGFIETDKCGVVNGDTGVIDSIQVYKDSNKLTHRVIYVKYDDHYIAYDNDFDELSWAYAMTIHKSQGSQWPIVLCPIVQSTMLLNRKLLYTMYTRAQETNILIGKQEYINRAVDNDKEERRITLLQARLKNLL